MKRDHPLLAVISFSLFTLLSSISVAAQPQSDDKVDLRYRQSLTDTQIEQVTNDLTKDTTVFQPLDRAILWARIGDLWWKTDAQRGRGFLLKAIQDVETAAAAATDTSEVQAKPAQLMSAIGLVMRIVAARDSKLSDRLIKSVSTVTSEVKGNSSSENSQFMADALVDAARQIVADDPARATQLGLASLSYGDANQFNLLLVNLRDRNNKLADNLFVEALRAAQISQNINLFSSLTFAAFTANYNPGLKATPPPPEIRASLLNAIIKGVIQADMLDKQRDCSYAFLISPLLTEVDQLAPQHAAPVRNAVAKCKSMTPGSGEAIGNQSLKTAEDFLSAARSAERIEVRVLLLSRAVQAAALAGNFDLAISTLDGLSREEREVMGDAWDPIRVQSATQAGMRSYENKDFAALERIINAVPHELQAFVALNVAEAMLGDNQQKNTFVIDLLGRARRRFEKMENPDYNTFYPYMSLVRAFGKVSPPDALSVFREAVKSINRVTLALKEKTDPSELTARGQFEPLDIPAELVQLSAFDLISIVSSVDSPALRTRLRLSLLGSLLSYKQSLLKSPPKRPATDKRVP